jgi:hypothetical protein
LFLGLGFHGLEWVLTSAHSKSRDPEGSRLSQTTSAGASRWSLRGLNSVRLPQYVSFADVNVVIVVGVLVLGVYGEVCVPAGVGAVSTAVGSTFAMG